MTSGKSTYKNKFNVYFVRQNSKALGSGFFGSKVIALDVSV